MPPRFRSGLLALALFAGCDTKVTSTIDTDLQQRIETLNECFPHLFDSLQHLFALASTWRLRDGLPNQDPPGLGWVEQPDGSIAVTYGFGTLVNMTMRFYSPAGVQQDLILPGAGTLDAAIAVAATQLDTLFPGDDEPFLVGDWTLSGAGMNGSGTLTGLIGGSTNDNELAELRTTAASTTIAGGPPAVASGSIAEGGAAPCGVTFTIPMLLTDESSDQLYPIGAVAMTITGPDATFPATITFDGTRIATIVVDRVRGSFAFDIQTRALTYVP